MHESTLKFSRAPRWRWLPAALAIAFTLLSPWLLVATAWADPTDGLAPATGNLDRATPRRAMTGFLQAARAGDYERAAHYMDLRNVPRAQRAEVGPEIARKLVYVLDRQVQVDAAQLPDEPDAATAVAGSLFLDDEPINIALTRIKFSDGVFRWLIARPTVSLVPSLYTEYGPREWADKFPPSLSRHTFLGNALWQWIGLLVVTVASYLAARVLAALLLSVAGRIAKGTKTQAGNVLVRAARRPVRLVLFVVFVKQVLPELHLTAAVENVVEHVGYTLLVIATAWFVIRAINVGTRWAEERLPPESQADMRQRSVQTQLAILRRIATVVVAVVSIAVGLVQFEFVRNLGISLLASASLAGVVLGFAAQRSLAGIIAGIQLSLSQPMRIGDAVVVEKEFGFLEEINLTYVVVRLWDQRRLVVPMSRFLEQPFENWSRISGDLLGSVFIVVDFRTPVQLVREELLRVCQGHEDWDRRLCTLVVFESTERGMTLRALVSSSSATRLAQLRFDVRERLIAFLRDLEKGRFLPPMRPPQFFYDEEPGA